MKLGESSVLQGGVSIISAFPFCAVTGLPYFLLKGVLLLKVKYYIRLCISRMHTAEKVQKYSNEIKRRITYQDEKL